MGALTGSITFSTYYVDGEPDAGFKDEFIAAMNKRRFKEIDVAADLDESIGWTSISDPFDSEFELAKVSWGDYWVCALRQDVIRIPAAAFKLHFKKALGEYLAQTGKERATKAEEEEVKDHLEKSLRRRVLPSIRTYDVVWNLQRGVVWFWTTNKRMGEIFTDLFTDTFGFPLIPKNPYALLERMELPEELMKTAIAIEPAVMSAPPRED